MQLGRVICYGGRQLKVHEKNYPTHNLELAAIVFALKSWHYYLQGERLELYMDQKSFKYLSPHKDLRRSMLRVEFGSKAYVLGFGLILGKKWLSSKGTILSFRKEGS